MALPGLAIQTENMVDDARTHADYLYLWDSLEAESLAQQWFGNHVSVRDPRELWLMRAAGALRRVCSALPWQMVATAGRPG